MKSWTFLAFVTAITLANQLCQAADWDAKQFDRKVASILADRCLSCHSGAKPKGRLDLSKNETALKGGESGPAFVGKSLDKSLLWQRIDAGEMPPENSLPKAERAVSRDWIANGAVWGTSPIDVFRLSSKSRAGYDWWSLQPIREPLTPAVSDVRTAIDAFVQVRLADAGLKPSKQASPRVIIRRLTFDLLGLPPKPEEVAAFEKAMQKDSDAAIKALVDRLLNSWHFGERWGRHWLDVVRFGESQGFERDKIRRNSWYYRDWVVNAINNDMPYDEFVRMQLAGDVLKSEDHNAVIATGFLVAGPWDEVGQSMRSAAMKAVVRQDEIEDYVGTIGQAFLGLTVNCARCHDHKFDPIRQKEYYQLAATVSGVRHGNRMVSPKEHKQKTDEINAEIRGLQDLVAKIDAEVRNELIRKAQGKSKSNLAPRVRPVARWDFEKDMNDSIGNAHAVQHPKARREHGKLVLDDKTGYAATHPVKFALNEKTLEAWVKLDNVTQRAGGVITVHSTDGATFDAIVFAEKQPKRWMAGSDYFKRTQRFEGPEEADTRGLIHLAITYQADGTVTGYRNGQPYGKPYKVDKPMSFPAGEWYVLFGLRCRGPAAARQLRGRMEAAQIYDRALTAEEVRTSFELEKSAITHDAVFAAMSAEHKTERAKLERTIAKLEKERDKVKPFSIYAVAPRTAEVAHLLNRGNPAQKVEEVTPGGIASLSNLKPDFGLPVDASDADRRRRLADWITDKNSPLFARVIVNRLWHYHFGVGLVDTPNDFGFNGGRPSHPELIDYLATELIKSGWSLKHIHRLIVTSATYLQSSRYRADCGKIDADNRLLWRKSPMRLEAEALRDSILFVTGQLNPQFGGPPYEDFTTFVNNSQFYTMVDKDSPDVYRRTLYRTWIRSGRNHLLDVFDCPDPSTTAPKRTMTTTPLQALTLMNNSFILRMSDRFADRVNKAAKGDTASKAKYAYRLAYGREPADEELRLASTFIDKHGLAAFCRVILNSNEFIHVD